MAMITVTSKCNTNLSQKLSNGSNDNHLRDASFSSYLNGAEESFVRKLAASSSIFGSQDEKLCPERKEQEDGEIGVFSAEKYFNGAMDDSPRIVKVNNTRNYQYVKDHERIDPSLVNVKPRIQAAGTPSVRSESSWNSQSALLRSVLRNNNPINPSTKKTHKVQGKRFLAGLRCKCYCSDKDSVDINEHVGETSFKRSADNGVIGQGKTINTTVPIKPNHLLDAVVQIDKPAGSVKENCFSFQTEMENHPINIHFQEVEEEKPSKSLEVFGCPVVENKNKSLSLERRLTMLSWDATPRLDEIEFSANSNGENHFETESDASSDLFEIESLTGKGKGNPFLARQGSGATSGCVTPTAYAPSEASIEWSVATASAADFSVMSECEEVKPATSPVKTYSNAKTRTVTAEIPKGRRPSISLGCNSNKAVRVAGDAHLTGLNQKGNNYEPRMRRMSDSFAPVAATRFQAETKLTGFDSRQRQNALTAATRTHSLPRSTHSPRASHLLYIQ